MNKIESRLVISHRINELKNILLEFESACENQIIAAAELIAKAILGGKKILICGNGGSAADSQHFAAELVSSFSKNINRKAISAIALTTDSSILTAFSNDFSFEKVFARQVEAHGKLNDVLIPPFGITKLLPNMLTFSPSVNKFKSPEPTIVVA